LRKAWIEPSAGVFPGLHVEAGVHLPVIPCDEGADLLLAFDENGERGRLDAPDRRQIEAALPSN
jgi:hypothetical protein